VELVHNFSLIHDDIEDDSDTRRHRPTVWSLWGIPQAINTGDAMWAVARLTCHRLGALGHPAERVLRVMVTLDEACVALCAGQYLDLAFEEQREVSLNDYMRMIGGKTAALLSGPMAPSPRTRPSAASWGWRSRSRTTSSGFGAIRR